MLTRVPRAQATAYERHAPDPRVVARALAPAEQQVFWLEDAGVPQARTALTSSVRADLAVVGGGYLGLWTALLATRRDPGRRVVLVEAESLGWAASGRNGGFCEASITHGEENGRSRWPDEYDVLERLGVENLAAFESDVETLGLDCQWERTGVLSVAIEPHQVEWLGDDVLDAASTRAQIDSPLFLAGSWEKEHTALVHPGRLARELGRAAAAAGVEVFEGSPVLDMDTSGSSGPVTLRTARGSIQADQVVLATNVFPSLVKRTRPLTVPVYDYVLMTEPLSDAQLASIGWANRQGLADLANQFHYSRLTADNRILYGGYDAVYFRGGRLKAEYEDRPETFARLASHLLATFPQLEDVAFTHKWAGAIDTCTRFSPYFGTARQGRVAYSAGFTGLGSVRPGSPRRCCSTCSAGPRRSGPGWRWSGRSRCPSRRSRPRRSASTSRAGRSTGPTTARDGATSSCARWTSWASASTPEPSPASVDN